MSQKIDIPGSPPSTKTRVLETGSGMLQDFTPLKQVCGHLNAFHVYASDQGRCVETNHYCSTISEDIRQCLLYDSTEPKARLLGVEYMISPRLFEMLPPEERRLWHTHEYEVKSGMLIMPTPSSVPKKAWDVAETAEMKTIAPLYGKTYHFWQIDKGDPVPMGVPHLMGSFTSDESVRMAKPGGLSELVKDRDQRFGVDYQAKAEMRKDIEPVKKHPDADCMWPGR